MANFNNYGASFRFGFTSSDAPTISGFSIREVDGTYEPEVFSQAMDGEGHTEAVATSKATHRKISASFTGYVSSAFSGNAIPNTFNFTVNSVSRFFIVKSIGEPRKKGIYVEVSLQAESFALVSS